MEAESHENSTQNGYSQVIPDIRDWPIYALSQERTAIVETVISETIQNLKMLGDTDAAASTLVADAFYQERIRMKEVPWKVDRKDEPAFWRRIKAQLQANAANPDAEQGWEILETVVKRYAWEIAGDFRRGTYNFARKVVNVGFSRLFNAANEGLFRSILAQRRQLQEKMQLTGHLEEVRRLTQKGTVILVPTHFSNLDSIVIGWAIEALGLPAYTYGAGINLFGHPVLSYFMGRLGAFRVDRRKKNQVYLTVLKTYTEVVLRHGAHMLFFPGGTRSRSGSIETRLKLGLLGTAIEAQRKLILANPDSYRRFYVVPMVMSYHTVLEAGNLIDQSLKREGKERYVLVKDDFRSVRKTLKYIWNFLRDASEMVFSFGEPMDLFGNRINAEGESIDQTGRVLDLGDYFRSGGDITGDPQRNNAYTRILGDRILQSYYRENIVFSSHLVAFAALQTFLRQRKTDIYGLLMVQEDDLVIPADEFAKTMERLHVRLREMERADRVKLADHLKKDMDTVIEHGIRNLGIYHVQKPLKRDESGNICTEDLKLLFFYNNRMNGYDLEKYV